MNIEQKRIVVVLGMHRSGTSSVTRGLQVLGIDLGNKLMKPKAGNNDKGFWEDTDIVDLNDDLLRTLGHDWHAFGPIAESELRGASVERFRQQAADLLKGKMSEISVLGLKDPRMARLLPFWQDVFDYVGIGVSYIVAFRNPMNVALSLARRDGFSREKSYLLWLDHMVTAIRYTKLAPRIVIDYDRILANPIGELERIATRLDFPFDAHGKEAVEYVEEFLDEALRHGVSSMDEFIRDPAAPQGAIEFAALLAEEAKARGGNEQRLNSAAEEIWNELGKWRAIYQYARSLEIQLKIKTTETSTLGTQLTRLEERIAIKAGEAQSLALELAAIKNSRSWKWTSWLRWLIGQVRYLTIKGNAVKNVVSERFFFDQSKSQKWIEELTSSNIQNAVFTEQPLVSIIMPTRNRVGSIGDAIDSVVAQKYKNWELLVVDDGSTDNTQEFIRSKYKSDQIRVLASSGVGVCGARNIGLEAAEGKYIAYLDSDNTWTSDYLCLMLCELMRSKRSTAYAALEIWNARKTLGGRPWYRQTRFDYESLKHSNFIDLNIFIHESRLYKELGGFDSNLKRMVDWDLIIRYTKDHPPAYANFIGARYDNSPSPTRITNTESLAWLNVVRNRYLINWSALKDDAGRRDANLVSIVICVHGQKDVTEACLQSIFKHHVECNFEVILVDNGSDKETASMLEKWGVNYPNLRLLKNRENYNFALGCNLGFAQSLGTIVVFLKNGAKVSSGWLDSLVAPLRNMPEIKGTQPKLLYPDGTIQNVGIVFSDRSPFGYPIYAKQPGDYLPTQFPRKYSALTAACFAVRAEDFISLRGFDPIYVNGQEDIDFCLRLGNAEQVFQYVPDSIVVTYKGRDLGASKNTRENRQVFFERWQEKIKADDQEKYAEDNISVTTYLPDNQEWVESGYAVWHPELSFPSNSKSKN